MSGDREGLTVATELSPVTWPEVDPALPLQPLRILSLTGGGYRGIFSAQVLAGLCRLARFKGSLKLNQALTSTSSPALRSAA